MANLYIVDNYLLARVSRKRCFKNVSQNITSDFSSIKDCICAMKKENVDIVLLDADLLVENITKTVRLLKNENPKIKIIIVSSSLNENIFSNTILNRINAYVFKRDKSVNFTKIIEKVEKGEFHIDADIANRVFNTPLIIEQKSDEIIPSPYSFKKNLTERELEVLKLMIDGKTNSQIAKEIIVSTNTAKAHVGSILTKLSVTDRVQAVVKAVRANIF